MNEIETLSKENAELKKRLKVYEDDDEKSIFASRLKQARKAAGMTQQSVSVLSGISRADVGLYETDRKKPCFENLILLADALNVSVDWLCGRTEKMTI